MTLAQIVEVLEADVIVGTEHLDREIATAGAADLMSDVLSFAHSGCLLVTGLVSQQAARTAFALDVAAIVICRGKKPSHHFIEIAKELNIPVLATKYIMFETCGRLYANGIMGRARNMDSGEVESNG